MKTGQKVYEVKSCGGQGHVSELIGMFDEITPELQAKCDKEWWSITEHEVKHYNETE